MQDLKYIVIGDITLDHIMWWTDEFSYLPRTTVSDRTLQGNFVYQNFNHSGGRPITLSGDDSHGFQSRSTVKALMAMFESNDQFIVQFQNISHAPIYYYSCRFRHEEEPALEFKPCSSVDNPDNSFWYTGTIKLVTL